MKSKVRFSFMVVAVLVTLGSVCSSMAFASEHAEEKKNNKVFFRGAYSRLITSRGNEVFTDTLSAAGVNGGKGGFSVGAGLDLGLMKPGEIAGVASLAGEIFLEYSRFSHALVRQTTSALLAGTNNSTVDVTELNVGVNPKVRFDNLGRFRPFVIPAGLAFLVVSPPSNDSTYLDIGLNFGAGVDFEICKWMTVGVDARYTHGFKTNNTNTSYFSTGASVGVLF